MFEPIARLGLGLITGILFGVLLQKGQVAKYRTIVGQFLLRDFTVLKVMLTAVVVGGIGVYALIAMGLATPHIKPLMLGGVILGGLIFGVGMAVLGYCPGTGIAALAEGSRDAVFGVLGMFTGAAIYAETYPWIKRNVLSIGDFGNITLADMTGVPTYVWLGLITVIAVTLFVFLENLQRPSGFEESTRNASGDNSVPPLQRKLG